MAKTLTARKDIEAALRDLLDQFVTLENVAYEQIESRLQISVNGKLKTYEDGKGAEMFSVHCGSFEGENSIVAFPVACVLEVEHCNSGRVVVKLR